MYISDMNKKSVVNKKKGIFFQNRALVLVFISVLCIIIDNVYAIFGHGVRSKYMSYMFLYSLGGGIIYFLFKKIIPKSTTGELGRFGINLFNSGIATLTAGSFLVGVLEIAGSSSDYVSLFFIVGWGISIIGFLSLIISGITKFSYQKN